MPWWQREAREVITEIRSVKSQLATTHAALQEFELRLSAVIDRQSALNEEIGRREASADE